MEHILIAFLTIFLCGVGTQWISWRFNIPGIALFLLTGFFVGPVMGWVEPDFLRNNLLHATVVTFVAVILFEGSLQLKWREFRESGKVIGHLVFMGGFITLVLGAIGAVLILGLEPRLAVLLGAILVVTGPTVVLPLLRQIRPAGRLGAILKWEGIAIDPLGALSAVLILEVIQSTGSKQVLWILTTGVLKTILLGAFIGIVSAAVIIYAIRKYLVPENIRNTFVLAVVVSAFIIATLTENEPTGFLTVTVMGIILANQSFIPIRNVLVFKETLKTLILPTLFIILAARLPINDLPFINGRAFLFLLYLILIVRPAAVFLSTRLSDLTRQEKLFLSFMAPRGIVAAAVASLFSDRLVNAGVSEAGVLVILVFFIVSSTVIFYGMLSPALAKALKIARPRSSGFLFFGAGKFASVLARALQACGADILMVDRNADRVKAAAAAGLVAIEDDIFSDTVLDLVEERGLGRFLALTPNHEANSLAVEHFRHFMEPGELYQLTPPGKSTLTGGHHLVGRFLFHDTMNYSLLEKIAGEEKISPVQSIKDDSVRDCPCALFSIDKQGSILFATVGQLLGTNPGRIVYGFGNTVSPV